MASSSSTSMSDFTILNKLGTGAFSEVYKVIRKSDRKEYALKKVRLSKLTAKEKDNAINEVRILASIRHENVAGYKEAFFEQGTNSLCIVMEYANGGDLQTKINSHKRTMRHLKEEDIWSIFYQMVNGLNALHKKKIVHRDIKCANVFLTKDGVVKLGDLNVSKVSKAGVMNTQTGTPYYASPEVWQDKPYDKSSDIWSLGAVLYEMVALNPPFQAKDMKGLFQRVVKGNYPAIPKTFSSDLSSMIASLLKVDPKKRPSAEQILHMPVFIAKYNEHKRSSGVFGEEAKELIGTIKVPKNLSLLTESLPASQYEQPQQEPLSQLSPGLPQIQEQQDDGDYVPMVRAHVDRLQQSEEKGIVRNRLQSGNRNLPVQQRNGPGRNQSSVIASRNMTRRPSGQLSQQDPHSYVVGPQEEPIMMERGGQQSELMHVQPYQKKYLQGVPGSSPVIRATDDLNFQQKYGKGPLIERAERLKRLQELKDNMQVRNSERGESDDGVIRMIKDHRIRRVGGAAVHGAKQRAPSSNLDIIHKNKDSDVQILYNDVQQEQNNLPSINGSQLQTPGNGHRLGAGGGVRGSRFVKPPLHQIYAPNGRNDGSRLKQVTNNLSRARSKDYIHQMETPSMRGNRYGAGASGIIEAGRQESQRLLMERYRRIDVSEQQPVGGVEARQRAKGSRFVGSSAHHNYYSNNVGRGQENSIPPMEYSRQGGIDSSRHYIPMSQKGTRPVQQYSQAGSRALHPAMAMKLMYNQPSQAGGFSNITSAAGGNYHVHGGGVSRPSWWG